MECANRIWETSVFTDEIWRTTAAPRGGHLFDALRGHRSQGPDDCWLPRRDSGKADKWTGAWPYKGPSATKDVSRVLFAIMLSKRNGICSNCLERDVWYAYQENKLSPSPRDDCTCCGPLPLSREAMTLVPPSRGVMGSCPYCHKPKSKPSPKGCDRTGRCVFIACRTCIQEGVTAHKSYNYWVAGSEAFSRAGGGYVWGSGEAYCVEHWRRWLPFGLAHGDDAKMWVEWAEKTITACPRSGRWL